MNTQIIILAAGKGKRMKSMLPKVLHQVSGNPMLFYPLNLARSIGAYRIITVIGYGGHTVQRIFRTKTNFAWQKKQAGTADAVRKCEKHLRGFQGNVVILCGDAPLLRRLTLKKLLAEHRESSADATVLSARVEEPSGYGRIVRNTDGNFLAIREEKDASFEEREIHEVNTGAYVFKWSVLKKFLNNIKTNNKQGERYLTDAPVLMRKAGYEINIASCETADEAMGINSRAELARANQIMNQRIIAEHSENGVTFIDPSNTYIEDNVKIGKDTTIHPFTYIEKEVRIGKNCSIGPFCKIRSGSVIGNGAVVGSFVEVVRSKIGEKTNVKHLTYLGDATVGRYVNIGAGTITANFDGRRKQKTIIGDRSFVGCDTVFVAPVRMGDHAKTGAGTVIPRGRDVKSGTTVVGVPSRPLPKVKKR